MSAFSDAVIALSPSSYWRLNNSLSDSGSGGITLTGNGTVAYVPSLVPSENFEANSAVNFDGTTTYLTGGDVYDFNAAWGTVKWTVMVVFNPHLALGGHTQRLIEKRLQTGNAEGWYLHFTGGSSDNLTFQLDYGATQEGSTFDTTLVKDGVYLAIFTLDSSIPELKCYVNGSLIGTDTAFLGTAIPNNAGVLTIGADGGGTSKFDGVIDEVAIWGTTAITGPNVTTLWNTFSQAQDPANVIPFTTTPMRF